MLKILYGGEELEDAESSTFESNGVESGSRLMVQTSEVEEVVINWEDLFASHEYTVHNWLDKPHCPEIFYKGRDGIHFHHPAGFGIQPGVNRDDPGNWHIEGTNGGAFWAIWGEDGNAELTFDRPTVCVQFDIMNQDRSAEMTVIGMLVGEKKHIDKRQIDPDVGQTFLLDMPVDKIVIKFPKPFGMDNIRFQLSAV